MKNIKLLTPEKYCTLGYLLVSEGIYEKDNAYFMSLCFEQEPDYGESISADIISQYPLEDILNKFFVFVSDFYEVFNTKTTEKCCLEFSSSDIADLKKLRSIIGKHVYNKTTEKNGLQYADLIIE